MAQLQEKYQSAYTGADLDAAIARSKNVTATDIELNYSSGVTSPIQTQIDGKSTVSVAATGTATDEVQYITVDGVEKKIGGGAEYTAGVGINITNNVISNTLKVGYEDDIDYPTKGDKITVEGRSYRVLADNGDHKYLLLDVTPLVSEAAWHSVESNDYFGSTIDTYLNTTYYATLSATLQAGIQDTSINQYSYTNDQDRYLDPVTHASTLGYATKTIKATNNRKIFALDPDEIETYFNNKFSVQNLIDLFEVPSGGMYIVAFRNAAVDTSSNQQFGFASLDPDQLMSSYINGITTAYASMAAFHYFAAMVVDLSVVPFVPETSKNAGRGVRLIDENGTVLDVTSKQDKLTAGENITIGEDNTISATDTKYTAGTNVQINNNVISATDTTYSAGSKITITDNTIATSANEVSVSATGSATDEVQYITIDGVEKKLAGGGGGGRVDYEEAINWPVKGDKVVIENKTYLVLMDKGNHQYLLLAQTDSCGDLSTWGTTTDYFTSTIDTYLTGTYLPSLSAAMQAAIQEVSITQYSYTFTGSTTETHASMFDYSTKAVVSSANRKVYTLDIDDIETYFNSVFTGDDLVTFFNNAQTEYNIYNRSKGIYEDYNVVSWVRDSAINGAVLEEVTSRVYVRPAMVVDLSLISFVIEGEEPVVGKAVNLLDENGLVLNVVNKQDKIKSAATITLTDPEGFTGQLTQEQTDNLKNYKENYITLDVDGVHVILRRNETAPSQGDCAVYADIDGLGGGAYFILVYFIEGYYGYYEGYKLGYSVFKPAGGLTYSSNSKELSTTVGYEISITDNSGTLSTDDRANLKSNEFNTLLHDGQRLTKLTVKGSSTSAFPMTYGSVSMNDKGEVVYKIVKVNPNGKWTLTTNKLADVTYKEKVSKPLCFTANTAGSTVRINPYTGLTSWTGSYSTDGVNWTPYTIGNTITLTNAGDKVYFKGTATAAFTSSAYMTYIMNGSIAASGNIMSLWCGDNFATATEIPYNYLGYKLFQNCAALTSAPELPATTLKTYCYYYMFYNCTGLTTPPALPAMTVQDYSYSYMFSGCSNLTTAPALPATNVKTGAYNYMFYNCQQLTVSASAATGIVKEWRLPANGMYSGTSSYYMTNMFTGCAGTRSSDTFVASGRDYGLYYVANTPKAKPDVIEAELVDVASNTPISIASKQDVLTAETDIVVKTMTGGITYLTTAPTAANTDGLKIVVLSSEPATKYDGYLYLITE